MTSIYVAPDWLYKPAKLNPELYPVIRKELLKIFQTRFQDTKPSEITSQFVVPADVHSVKKSCPALMEQLNEYGLADSFVMLAMIIVTPGPEYPVHVDTLNPGRMSFGLNIPVLNCNDSYTAWYDTEILYHETFAPNILTPSIYYGTALPCRVEGAVEIDRCSADTPHWINVIKPHAAVCNHSKLRVNSSLRFDKKIFEMVHDGSFYERCVNDVL